MSADITHPHDAVPTKRASINTHFRHEQTGRTEIYDTKDFVDNAHNSIGENPTAQQHVPKQKTEPEEGTGRLNFLYVTRLERSRHLWH